MSDVTDLDLALSKHCRRNSDPQGDRARILAQYDAALRAEVLAVDGQDYDGELTMLRGLVATLSAVAQHGDLSDVQKLLREHTSDAVEARGLSGSADDADPEQSKRAELIAGIRAFAYWLEQNPDVDDPGEQRFLLALHTNQAVEEFVARHGLTAVVDDDGNASVDLFFGPITYHVYGYADFAQHLAERQERSARQWADQNGMTIQAAEDGGE
ncbi:hypothetical protein [Streptomyces sp. bgisy034]|uniref:hypothetical protein n=1 Tax=Streptomyces sp. bgisy034 TaxID=3413774 RepID=UPI003EBC57B3